MITIFDMNDYDWWAGETKEECMEAMQEFSGYAKEEMQEMIDSGYPEKVSSKQMDNLTYVDSDNFDESGECVKRTFREQLDFLIKEGTKFPCFFASTEY